MLHNSLGKNYSGSRKFTYCKGVQNPICKSPISGENAKLDKNVNRTILISGTGSFVNVREWSNPKSSTNTRAISEQPPPCKKKRCREPPSDKFKKSQQVYSLRTFQNGRFALSDIPSRTENLLCKIDLKKAYFSIPLNKNTQKFVTFQWSHKLYELFCLCFALGQSNCYLETGQHSNHYLSRRYVANGENVIQETLMARSTLIFYYNIWIL